MDNRVWLPFLQFHIFLFYKLGLPYYTFKLIPCFYFFLALLFLAKLTYKILGQYYPRILFPLLILFVFSHQRILFNLSVSLYQEMLEIFFFYLLLYMGALELKKSGLLLLMASMAVFIRETFWVYLLVLTICNRTKIFTDKTYKLSFIWLWSLVAGWLFTIPFLSIIKFHRLPKWPIMINNQLGHAASIFTSLSSLHNSFYANRIQFLILGLIIIYILKAGKITKVQNDEFGSRFKIFSLLSLGIIYGYIILFDPWEYTPGNSRMGVVLLSHIFIWASLFFKESFCYPKFLRLIYRCVLFLSLLTIIPWGLNNLMVKDYSADMKTCSEIISLGKDVSGEHKPNVCILNVPFWEAIDSLAAPTLYMNITWLFNEKGAPLDNYDIVITPLNYKFENSRFLCSKVYELNGKGYTFYMPGLDR